MRIAVIFTGGTIGSCIDNTGYISPDNINRYKLIDMYRKSGDTETEFVTYEPYRILSENLQAGNLIRLCQCLHRCLKECDDTLDGVIITHGTDTLQYSAALLSYIFGAAPIPIVLVSSAYVLEDPKANGLVNFMAAVSFIKAKCGKGVFVSYTNDMKTMLFHRGSRMQTPSSFSADMDSILNSWYASAKISCHTNPVISDLSLNPCCGISPEDIPALPICPDDMKLSDPFREILRIHICPGINYPDINADDCTYIRVILLESYHSGTICLNDALYSFLYDAEKANIPVYLTGLNSNVSEYQTVREYEKLGIIPLPVCAPISQYCKLWLAVSNDLDLKAIMAGSFAGDWVWV